MAKPKFILVHENNARIFVNVNAIATITEHDVPLIAFRDNASLNIETEEKFDELVSMIEDDDN